MDASAFNLQNLCLPSHAAASILDAAALSSRILDAAAFVLDVAASSLGISVPDSSFIRMLRHPMPRHPFWMPQHAPCVFFLVFAHYDPVFALLIPMLNLTPTKQNKA